MFVRNLLRFGGLAACGAVGFTGLVVGTEAQARADEPTGQTAPATTSCPTTSSDSQPGDGCPKVMITTFLAADVYDDSQYVPDAQKSTAKFVVVFNDGPGQLQPSDISELVITGPNGFTFNIVNQEFAYPGFNGWIRDPVAGDLWWEGFLAPDANGNTAFLADGKYQVRVDFADGAKDRAHRKLTTDPDLLSAYLALKSGVQFSPSGTAAPAAGVPFSWTTLASLGGPKAYYNVWASPDPNFAVGFVDAQTGLQSNIFAQAATKPKAGLNMSSFTMTGLPMGDSVWFTEILDSNVLDDINLAIFQPIQFFVAD